MAWKSVRLNRLEFPADRPAQIFLQVIEKGGKFFIDAARGKTLHHGAQGGSWVHAAITAWDQTAPH
jgi:hypothetical protein